MRLDTWVSTREVAPWMHPPTAPPPPPPPPPLQLLATFAVCIVSAWVCPSPPLPQARATSRTRHIGKLTTYFFPQVPPGAAETQKAPGTSELHGGHLQGTGIRGSGSERGGRLGLRYENLALEQGTLARAWQTWALIKGLKLNK